VPCTSCHVPMPRLCPPQAEARQSSAPDLGQVERIALVSSTIRQPEQFLVLPVSVLDAK
jgi:hypothetical protein